MSDALDAAFTVAVYAAWSAVILALVVGIAAVAFRYLPDRAASPPERGGGDLPTTPATTDSTDWEWPLRRRPFDPVAYKGSIAEAAVEKVFSEREEIENG